MSDDNSYIIEERKKRIVNFIKRKTITLYLALLAVIIWIASYIRTRNLYGLKDITNGQWTLGPDLDPFLFLRWAKYIIANGSLFIHDTMRYVPLGLNTSAELKLVPYSIVWFHKLINLFGNYTIEYSAVIVPVFIFALAIIAFFFFVREIFKKEGNEHKANIIAIIASFFFAVIPSILPRTIAGIPEKENLGFLFMFVTFYFFIRAWKEERPKWYMINSLLAGISTALMAHAWGGSIYIYITIAVATLILFLVGAIKKKHLYLYTIWIVSFLILLLPFTERYTLRDLLASSSTGLMFGVWGILIIDYLIHNTQIKDRIPKRYSEKLPRSLISIIIAVIIGILTVSIIFGPTFIPKFFGETVKTLMTPYSDRLSFTVAENRQPFFTDEWRGSFGPIFAGIPLFFWMFFIGSIYLFYEMIKHLHKKDKIKMVGVYTLFLFALIFSKYDGGSILNGTSATSKFLYFGGIIILLIVSAYTAWTYYKRNELEVLTKIDFSKILLFILFFISIVGSRSAIRLMMVLGPPAAIIVSYFIVEMVIKALQKKEGSDDTGSSTKMIWSGIAIGVVIAGIFTAWTYYQSSYYQAGGFIPNSYTQQWQKAMSWVRDNTPENAVFSHWWDYGYWVQSIGLRATIADGGNQYPYWDYLIGRHLLTNPSKKDSLEFLYTHNVTHLLIDSTDIGKYSAFSNIGSDENYDRASYIPTIGLDDRQTQETKNGTTYFWRAGFTLDEDIIYQTPGNNSKKVLLAAGRAGLGAITVNMGNNTITRPEGIFVDQTGQQYRIPIRYIYYNGKLYDFKEGIEAGMFIIPVATESGGGVSINPIGSALYLSKRVVNGNLARLYLFGEEGEGFRLAHTEDDFVVANLKSQGSNFGDFLYFNGLRGPIKIWDVDYSDYPGIKAKPEYLETKYPQTNLYIVK